MNVPNENTFDTSFTSRFIEIKFSPKELYKKVTFWCRVFIYRCSAQLTSWLCFLNITHIFDKLLPDIHGFAGWVNWYSMLKLHDCISKNRILILKLWVLFARYQRLAEIGFRVFLVHFARNIATNIRSYSHCNPTRDIARMLNHSYNMPFKGYFRGFVKPKFPLQSLLVKLPCYFLYYKIKWRRKQIRLFSLWFKNMLAAGGFSYNGVI